VQGPGGLGLKINRRQFLGFTGTAFGSALVGKAGRADAAGPPAVSRDAVGVLVDTRLCIGCRKCEQACAERHKLPDRTFEDMTVLDQPRRPDAGAYTVVNRYQAEKEPFGASEVSPVFVKFQCMHCLDPACASACPASALTKRKSGPVIYDVNKCIGCRYCMIACPFQIPTYEYDRALAPRMMKCTFCFEYISKLPREKGGVPACAEICPMEVMTYGKRSDLLELARWKIKNSPGKYLDHIFGEHEVGGTSWLYLASRSFDQLGFPKLGETAPPRLTETIQHGVFQGFASPLFFFGILGGFMWLTGRKNKMKKAKQEKEDD
jgi:formate dehydrogenase iron-sulfur subunit